MIRNNRLITAAILAAISKLAMAEEIALELKEVSVKSTATENTALNLKQTNSTASRLGLNAIDIPASVETLDIETVCMRGDISNHG